MPSAELLDLVGVAGAVVSAFVLGGGVGASRVFRAIVRETVRESLNETVRRQVEPVARDVRQLRREVVELRALLPSEGGA